jgi:hypothetical protein
MTIPFSIIQPATFSFGLALQGQTHKIPTRDMFLIVTNIGLGSRCPRIELSSADFRPSPSVAVGQIYPQRFSQPIA